jgi:hypothetical protein
MLKILGACDYHSEQAGLRTGERAVLFARALPDGRTVQTRLAIPEDQAESLAAERGIFRQQIARRLEALPLPERIAWMRCAGWRRI